MAIYRYTTSAYIYDVKDGYASKIYNTDMIEETMLGTLLAAPVTAEIITGEKRGEVLDLRTSAWPPLKIFQLNTYRLSIGNPGTFNLQTDLVTDIKAVFLSADGQEELLTDVEPKPAETSSHEAKAPASEQPQTDAPAPSVSKPPPPPIRRPTPQPMNAIQSQPPSIVERGPASEDPSSDPVA